MVGEEFENELICFPVVDGHNGYLIYSGKNKSPFTRTDDIDDIIFWNSQVCRYLPELCHGFLTNITFFA